MNSDHPQLSTVKVNRPEYSRAHSLQSTAATNEYFSDYASEASSNKSNDTEASYETPPSRISTPIQQQIQLDSEMTLPTRPGAVRPAPLNIRSRDITGERQSRLLSSFDDMSPPTPGVDDTPFIRFAIDQLTRDQEVAGHGIHSSVIEDTLPTHPRSPSTSTPSQTPASPPPDPPQRPEPPQQPSPQSIQKKPVRDELLLPVSAPEGQRWADLGYVPSPLRLPLLFVYLVLCILMMAGLIFSNVFSLRNHGLYDYDGNNSGRYLIFQYLPQIFGMILIIWLFIIEAAIYRVTPYFCISNGNPHDRVLQDFRILPANFVFPDLSFFRNGEPLLGVSFIIFWSTNFTIPLLSCLYQTEWITNDGPARWRWTAVQGVGWVLFALYVLLSAATIYCMTRFRSLRSFLMWDPCSIADLIVLFQRSNLLHDFERTEVAQDLHSHIPPRFLRLGYWTTSHRPEIFHSVGEESAPIKRLSLELSPAFVEKGNDSQTSGSFDIDHNRGSYASSFSRNIHSPFVRYRWTSWFLRDSAVLAWIIIAFLLLIAFLVVSFVHHRIQAGFLPLVDSRTSNNGFSASNLLYSFLPSLLGMFLFLAWQPIDTYFRATQPFARLSQPMGASAKRSILLSYNSSMPIIVTLRALANGDLKVAYISFIAFMSFTIPVLAGGVFTAQFFSKDDQVRMVASMPGFIALCVFLAIYALSYLIIWPTRKRYLPHNVNTIANILSFLYASPLMGDGVFRGVQSKAELIARLSSDSSSLTGDRREKAPSTRFAFGVYMGRDGRQHLGIDRLQRPSSGEVITLPGRVRSV